MGDMEVRVETLRPGDSTHYPQRGDTVRVHYEGFLVHSRGTAESGVKPAEGEEEDLPEGAFSRFDSSRARDRPLTFKVGEGQVILGWEEAIPKMSRGQIARVYVPCSKGYGITGYPPIIPPETDLIYDIELLSFVSPGQGGRTVS
mmetsp:Transcript_16843/g.42756  ORF Transcript_16843/g.42756 Transcript_16843/m.42756 type:complete len:145 (-) Transcript_16843:236-670(-)